MPEKLREFAVFLVKLPVAILRQFCQIASGLWTYATEEAELETFIPEWFLRLTLHAVPKAIAGDEPSDQIEGSIILIGWFTFTSLVTGGATIAFVLFWSLFFLAGVARYSDWGESAWSRATGVSMPGKDSMGRYRTRGRK